MSGVVLSSMPTHAKISSWKEGSARRSGYRLGRDLQHLRESKRKRFLCQPKKPDFFLKEVPGVTFYGCFIVEKSPIGQP